MEVLKDQRKLGEYISERGIRSNFSRCEPLFLLLHYFPGELLTSPFSPSKYLQFVVDGELLLYDMPDENSTVMLQTNYQQVSVLGEVEVVDTEFTPFFVEARTDVYTVAISVEQYRTQLLEDAAFLRLVCRSLCGKLKGAVTSSVSMPLKDRVLHYISHYDAERPITGIARLAKSFNVSSRQLLRVLRELCEEGILEHSRKGSYRILRRP